MAHDQDGRPLGGSDEDGTLILVFELPPLDADGPQFFFPQVRLAETHPLEIPWMGGDQPSQLIPSRRGATMCLRVEGPARVDLHARARLCRDPDCLDFEDVNAPEARLAIESPIYDNRETYVRTAFDGAIGAPSTQQILRCQVEGCIEGESMNFCLTEGTHFCDLEDSDIQRFNSIFDCATPIPVDSI